MTDVKSLTHEERVFLAGSIRDLILEDDLISESELDDLDSLSRRLDFEDYEKCLDEFVEKVIGEEAFMAAARAIVRPEAQQVILETLYEMQLRKNLPENEQTGVFGKLTALWPADAEGGARHGTRVNAARPGGRPFIFIPVALAEHHVY